MNDLRKRYRSLGLLTDLYQLTMANGYWKSGAIDREAVFHLFFRENPFAGGFAIGCGLSDVVDVLDGFRFDDSDISYLSTLEGNDARPLFERAFLNHLSDLRLTCDVDAVLEGTVVFSARTARAGPRTDNPVSDSGNDPAEHHQLPDTDRHQGGANLPRGPGRTGLGIWSSTVRWQPAARPTSEGARQHPMCWLESYSTFPSRERTLIAGSCRSTVNPTPFRPMRRPCPTTVCSWWTPMTPDRASATPSNSATGCVSEDTR